MRCKPELPSLPIECADAPPPRCATGLRLVGILAFGQSLLFLALLVWLCASVHAAPAPAKPAPAVQGLDLTLPESKYKPASTRDPFAKPGASTPVLKKTSAALPAGFRLQGILSQRSDPSAIVNGQVVSLHKPIAVPTSEGEYIVEAIEIGRDRVVLSVGNGQKLELRLDSDAASPATPPARQ